MLTTNNKRESIRNLVKNEPANIAEGVDAEAPEHGGGGLDSLMFV